MQFPVPQREPNAPKSKRPLLRALLLFAAAGAVAGTAWGAYFYWNHLRGAWPAITEPAGDIALILESPDAPLEAPPGFSVSVLADGIPGARVLAFEDDSRLWVSQTKEGKISRLTMRGGAVAAREVMFENLNKPHGLAFAPDNPATLYIAEEHRVSRVNLASPRRELTPVLDLPGASGSTPLTASGHSTRTIGFGPDGRLYVSVGSSCNVCRETDERRAAIVVLGRETGEVAAGNFPAASTAEIFAKGLRNAVFFDWHPETGEMWATEMGRDLLDDDTPPDEINIVREGGDYGWPTCYGKNVHDRNFDKNVYARNPCLEPFEKESYIDIPAHSAPLGLSFVPQGLPRAASGGAWPEEYRGNLIVAYHGSWNRTVPTGYKLVRMILDKNGTYLGTEDFITGWLAPSHVKGISENGALGRPVDVLFGPDGTLYVSDDKAGAVYKIKYQK